MRKVILFTALCFTLSVAGCGEKEDVTYPIELAMLAKEGKLPYGNQKEGGDAHASTPAASGLSAAELERQKAMAEPYPNDYGPETIDVSAYPKDIQAGYKTFQAKCTACHPAARPLNSEFIESKGSSAGARKAALGALKSSHPDMFSKKNRLIWKPEANIWQRFVKRMRAKPGCDITKEEVRQIWQFLSYDSLARKSGKNKKKWMAFRKKLVGDFKKKHPKRYKTLFENN
jgi:hypothetical protein